MPAGNGTGPRGFGSMTGRAAGYCAGFGRPGFTTPGPGGGMGFGFRGGHGRRRRGVRRRSWGSPAAQFSSLSRPKVRRMLQGQVEHLENTLSELKQRLSELETEKQQGGRE